MNTSRMMTGSTVVTYPFNQEGKRSPLPAFASAKNRSQPHPDRLTQKRR